MKSLNVTVLPYSQIEEDLKKLTSDGKKIAVDDQAANAELIRIIGDNKVIKTELVELIKAQKNKTEQDGMRNCHVRDMVALVRYLAFLESELKKPDHGLDECKGAD